MMIKRVNVFPVVPIYSVRIPIVGAMFNADLSVGDIGVCIYSRAKVEEILPDGSIILLNLNNYNTVNYKKELVEIEHTSNRTVQEVQSISPDQIIEDTIEEVTVETELTDNIVEQEQVEENLEEVPEYKSKKNKHNKR